MIKYNIPMLASSDPDSGAKNISSDGSTFQIILDRPLTIPQNAHNIYLEAKNATVWWTVPNIIKGLNDKFYIEHLGTPYVTTIPEGLYGVTDLSNKISSLLFNLGLPIDLIELLPDTAENKVVIQFNYAGTQIDFQDNTALNNFRELLGFDSKLVPVPATIASEFVTADNIAAFNTINYFLISCSLFFG